MENLNILKQKYGIIGESEVMNQTLEEMLKAAETDLPVLVTGECGTGKTKLSPIIHDYSRRTGKSFVTCKCGSIPTGVIDIELFGCEAGVLPGEGERTGCIESAHNGTLCIDEVDELPIETQERVVRFMQTGEYCRVGSDEVCKADVRIIALTRNDLLKAILEGKFLQELYERLSAITINVPPLRERGDDILLLFNHFSKSKAEKYQTEPISLTEDAMSLIHRDRWQSNVRELEYLVANLLHLTSEREITASTLLKIRDFCSSRLYEIPN